MALLYVVSRQQPDGEPWRIVGVFTSLDSAASECRDKSYGLSVHSLDVAQHDIPKRLKKRKAVSDDE